MLSVSFLFVLATGQVPAESGWGLSECWDGDYKYEACCDPRFGATGNTRCFDPAGLGGFTYSRCCLEITCAADMPESGDRERCCASSVPKGGCGVGEGHCSTHAECAGELLCNPGSCSWSDSGACCDFPDGNRTNMGTVHSEGQSRSQASLQKPLKLLKGDARPTEPIGGSSFAPVLFTLPMSVDADLLYEEVQSLLGHDWDWEKRGKYGHSLSLPEQGDLHPVGRRHKVNFPYEGLLEKASGLSAVFRFFANNTGGVAAFRLFRRGARTAYGLHTDYSKWQDEVPYIKRLALPLTRSANQSVLLAMDVFTIGDVVRALGHNPSSINPLYLMDGPKFDSSEEVAMYVEDFLHRGHARGWRLDAGKAYWFDNRHVHTLANLAQDEERFMLGVDVIENEWMRQQFPSMCPPITLQSKMLLFDENMIPVIGLGTYQVEPGETREAVIRVLKSGIRLIDTAQLYRNEIEVGEAIRDAEAQGIVSRSDVWVVTKLHWDHHGFEPAIQAVRGSLRHLGLDYIDLLLIHTPAGGRLIETWDALVEIQKSGLVKSLGVSNFGREHLETLRRFGRQLPTVNQIELSAFRQQIEIRKFMKEHGIIAMAYSPLGRGRILKEPIVEEVARKHGRTSAQVLLRWVLQQDAIALFTARRSDHIQENMGAFGFALEEADLNKLGMLPEKSFNWDPLNAPFDLGDRSCVSNAIPVNATAQTGPSAAELANMIVCGGSRLREKDALVVAAPDALRTAAAASVQLGRSLQKAEFPTAQGYLNLNVGTYGVCPLAVRKAQDIYRKEMEETPDEFFSKVGSRLSSVRKAIAGVLQTDWRRLALVESATAAMNAVLRSLTIGVLPPKCTAVFLSSAHPMIRQTLAFLQGRGLLQLEEATVDGFLGASEKATAFLEPLSAALKRAGSNVGLCVLSSMVHHPPRRTPIAEMASLCKQFGATYVVDDAAHAFGQFEVDLDMLEHAGVDFWGSTLHKWGFTPKGTAVIWASPRVVASAVVPNLISMYGPGADSADDWGSAFDWQGTRDYTAYLAVIDALVWRKLVGERRIMLYIHRLAIEGAAAVSKIWGTDALPVDSAMFAVRLPVQDPGSVFQLEQALQQEGIRTLCFSRIDPSGKKIIYMRFCAQIFLQLDDFEKAASLAKLIMDSWKVNDDNGGLAAAGHVEGSVKARAPQRSATTSAEVNFSLSAEPIVEVAQKKANCEALSGKLSRVLRTEHHDISNTQWRLVASMFRCKDRPWLPVKDLRTSLHNFLNDFADVSSIDFQKARQRLFKLFHSHTNDAPKAGRIGTYNLDFDFGSFSLQLPHPIYHDTGQCFIGYCVYIALVSFGPPFVALDDLKDCLWKMSWTHALFSGWRYFSLIAARVRAEIKYASKYRCKDHRYESTDVYGSLSGAADTLCKGIELMYNWLNKDSEVNIGNSAIDEFLLSITGAQHKVGLLFSKEQKDAHLSPFWELLVEAEEVAALANSSLLSLIRGSVEMLPPSGEMLEEVTWSPQSNNVFMGSRGRCRVWRWSKVYGFVPVSIVRDLPELLRGRNRTSLHALRNTAPGRSLAALHALLGMDAGSQGWIVVAKPTEFVKIPKPGPEEAIVLLNLEKFPATTLVQVEGCSGMEWRLSEGLAAYLLEGNEAMVRSIAVPVHFFVLHTNKYAFRKAFLWDASRREPSASRREQELVGSQSCNDQRYSDDQGSETFAHVLRTEQLAWFDLPHAAGHDFVLPYAGAAMLYYALVFATGAQTIFVLGSGGGFVPTILRQAQRDRLLGGGRVITVDASGGVGYSMGHNDGWGLEGSKVRKRFPELFVDASWTSWAARTLVEEEPPAGPSIDLLFIDADHSFEGFILDVADWLPFCHENTIIITHDSSTRHFSKASSFPLLRALGARVLDLKSTPREGIALIQRPFTKAGDAEQRMTPEESTETDGNYAQLHAWGKEVLRSLHFALSPAGPSLSVPQPFVEADEVVSGDSFVNHRQLMQACSGMDVRNCLLIFSVAYATRPSLAACLNCSNPALLALEAGQAQGLPSAHPFARKTVSLRSGVELASYEWSLDLLHVEIGLEGNQDLTVITSLLRRGGLFIAFGASQPPDDVVSGLDVVWYPHLMLILGIKL